MGYFSELDYELKEEECYEPDPYDDHVNACAHLPKHIWDLVSHLPTQLALSEGEKMMRQEESNKEIARMIWKDLP